MVEVSISWWECLSWGAGKGAESTSGSADTSREHMEERREPRKLQEAVFKILFL